MITSFSDFSKVTKSEGFLKSPVTKLGSPSLKHKWSLIKKFKRARNTYYPFSTYKKNNKFFE